MHIFCQVHSLTCCSALASKLGTLENNSWCIVTPLLLAPFPLYLRYNKPAMSNQCIEQMLAQIHSLIACRDNVYFLPSAANIAVMNSSKHEALVLCQGCTRIQRRKRRQLCVGHVLGEPTPLSSALCPLCVELPLDVNTRGRTLRVEHKIQGDYSANR